MRAWIRDILLTLLGLALIVAPAVITITRANEIAATLTGVARAKDGDSILFGQVEIRLLSFMRFAGLCAL